MPLVSVVNKYIIQTPRTTNLTYGTQEFLLDISSSALLSPSLQIGDNNHLWINTLSHSVPPPIAVCTCTVLIRNSDSNECTERETFEYQIYISSPPSLPYPVLLDRASVNSVTVLR